MSHDEQPRNLFTHMKTREACYHSQGEPKVRRRCKPEASEASEVNGSELDIGKKGINFSHVLFNLG